jgi:hypothetical protein
MPCPKLSEEARRTKARERKARWRQQVTANENQPLAYAQQQQQQEIQFISSSISQARPAKSPTLEPAGPRPLEDNDQLAYSFDKSRAPSASPSQGRNPSQATESLQAIVEPSEDKEHWPNNFSVDDEEPEEGLEEGLDIGLDEGLDKTLEERVIEEFEEETEEELEEEA